MKMGFVSIVSLGFLMFFQFSARRIRIMRTFWKYSDAKTLPAHAAQGAFVLFLFLDEPENEAAVFTGKASVLVQHEPRSRIRQRIRRLF